METLPQELEKNIPGADTILHTVPEDEARYDAFILLDSVPGRTGDAEKLYQEAALTINIDHHISNPGSGDVNYIDAAASSASELVYNVIDHDAIDKEIAQALYVGMVTDTGVFQYSSTGESTMCAAGHLMSYGFDFTAVIREVFFERTALQARMVGAFHERKVHLQYFGQGAPRPLWRDQTGSGWNQRAACTHERR